MMLIVVGPNFKCISLANFLNYIALMGVTWGDYFVNVLMLI